jgi:hypothetical protein
MLTTPSGAEFKCECNDTSTPVLFHAVHYGYFTFYLTLLWLTLNARTSVILELIIQTTFLRTCDILSIERRYESKGRWTLRCCLRGNSQRTSAIKSSLGLSPEPDVAQIPQARPLHVGRLSTLHITHTRSSIIHLVNSRHTSVIVAVFCVTSIRWKATASKCFRLKNGLRGLDVHNATSGCYQLKQAHTACMCVANRPLQIAGLSVSR